MPPDGLSNNTAIIAVVIMVVILVVIAVVLAVVFIKKQKDRGKHFKNIANIILPLAYVCRQHYTLSTV